MIPIANNSICQPPGTNPGAASPSGQTSFMEPNPPAIVETAKSESLTRAVREQIEGMIMRGEIGAGERLNEIVLATKLRVSRGPIREATRLLAEAGLVTMIHNRGAFVREINLEEVLHIYDVRAGLAYTAGRLAAIRAAGPQIAKLRELWQQMEDVIASQDSDAYYDFNRRFHSKIFEFAGNPRLIDFNDITEREVFLFLRRGVVGPSRPKISNKQHLEILEAIAAGDEVAAARAFENHVITGKQRMLDSLRSQKPV
jgi:DNA-binding GntR family transcriptional regulator